MPLSSHWFVAIGTAKMTREKRFELAAYELLAQWRDAVYEHCALKMVKLMLHDACQISLNPLIVLIEIGVKVFDMYARWTHHTLMYAGQ